MVVGHHRPQFVADAVQQWHAAGTGIAAALLVVAGASCARPLPVSYGRYRIAGVESGWRQGDSVVVECWLERPLLVDGRPQARPPGQPGAGGDLRAITDDSASCRERQYAVLPLDLSAFPQPWTDATFIELLPGELTRLSPQVRSPPVPWTPLPATLRGGVLPGSLDATPEGLSVYVSDARDGRLAVTWKDKDVALLRQFTVKAELPPLQERGVPGPVGGGVDNEPFPCTTGAMDWLRERRVRRVPQGFRECLPVRMLRSGEWSVLLLRRDGGPGTPGASLEYCALLPPAGRAGGGSGAVLRTVVAYAELRGPTPAMLALSHEESFTAQGGPVPSPPGSLASGVHLYRETDSGLLNVVVQRDRQTTVYVLNAVPTARLGWRWIAAPVVLPVAVLGDLTLYTVMAFALGTASM